MPKGTQIIGSGSAFPKKEMTNFDIEKFLDTSNEWIQTRTGIASRRIAETKRGETTYSLALEAVNKALEMAGVRGEEVDMIVVSTITMDTVMPTTAVKIQKAIGAHRAFAFDMQAACAGFLYGLKLVDSCIATGSVITAVIIGAETLSTILDWRDRTTCVLFGDGAGATVVRATDDAQSRVHSLRVYSDGRYDDILKIPHGYGAVPPYDARYSIREQSIQMQGKEVFKLAVRKMGGAIEAVLKDCDLTTEDIDLFVFHQANLRILEMCAKTLKIDHERMWTNLERYGNTSAATLPTCLDEAWRKGVVGPGKRIAMASFGGGVTWGAGVFTL